MRSSMRLAVASVPRAPRATALASDNACQAVDLGGMVRLVRLWICRHRERKALAGLNDMDALSDHILRDLGLTRAEARAEFTKPFWRA